MVSFIEKFVFLALVFSIPFQKRVFLFGPSPEGERFFEWGSGFLYFTDIFIVILAIFFLKSIYPKLNFGQRYKAGFGAAFVWFTFLVFAFASLAQAALVDVAVYRFIKLAEFTFLFFYVASYARTMGIKPILGAFVASGVFQSILAILQFAKQSSLGLEIFHESILVIGLKGVAEINVGGVEFIRAYGTFPSPNVLAGFLGICLFFVFYLFLKSFAKRQRYSLAHSRQPSGWLRGSDCFAPSGAMPKESPETTPESNTASPRAGLIYGIAVFLLSLGLILTFSRGVIVFFVFASALFFAGIFLLEKLKQYKKDAIRLAVLVVVFWVLIVAALWPEVSARILESSVGEPAIQERLFFNEVGLDTVRQNYSQLFFGVGLGNFVHHYMGSLPGLAPHLYQPVHNIFILIASEIGILGLIAFVLFLLSLARKSVMRFFMHSNFERLFLYVLILNFLFLILIGMYDHYFWTLQQGSLMLWISLGLLASAANNKKPAHVGAG